MQSSSMMNAVVAMGSCASTASTNPSLLRQQGGSKKQIGSAGSSFSSRPVSLIGAKHACAHQNKQRNSQVYATASRSSTDGNGTSSDSSAVMTSAELQEERCFNIKVSRVPHLRQFFPDLEAYPSPLVHSPSYSASGRDEYFVDENEVVGKRNVINLAHPSRVVEFFLRAGPRDPVYFKSEDVRAAIVTCGGLCPGLNTVVRELVFMLWTQYGVRSIWGVQNGLRGFYAANMLELTPATVSHIHKRGGTVLGTSRGGADIGRIVDSIADRNINQVYIIGGDGTHRAANAIYEETVRRKMHVSVAGIPKTIDNDIPVIDRSFGFDTAVEEAQRAINAAHVEAESTPNGVGLVKLMGRYSGFIAVFATLASRDVDCCLIPEVPFKLDGPGGLLEYVDLKLKMCGHCLIVVAEGAGQELLTEYARKSEAARDASGNVLLQNIGLYLGQRLNDYFISVGRPCNLKYIDPTYMVRAVPANASDNVYCTLLAHSVVHGAFAGFTGFTCGPVNARHCFIPIEKVTETNHLDVRDRMWARLMNSTGQPDFLPAASPTTPSATKQDNVATTTFSNLTMPQNSTPGDDCTGDMGKKPGSPQEVVNQEQKTEGEEVTLEARKEEVNQSAAEEKTTTT
eukprot:jgi/Chlat1/9267/Chrsp99S08536